MTSEEMQKLSWEWYEVLNCYDLKFNWFPEVKLTPDVADNIYKQLLLMINRPEITTTIHERKWNRENPVTHIVRYDIKTNRGFVTRIDKETGEEFFDHWEPADFRQVVKEKYNIVMK